MGKIKEKKSKFSQNMGEALNSLFNLDNSDIRFLCGACKTVIFLDTKICPKCGYVFNIIEDIE